MAERTISYAEAVRDGLAEGLMHHPEMFLMGEGLVGHGDFFGTTAGLADRFPADRLLEMPVAENAMVGVAIGAAMMGRRPVMSLQRVEFCLLALEQIFDNAAKMCWQTNGMFRVPFVMRLVIGRGWGQGGQHAQSLESVFGHFPGLKVVMPAVPADAKGMLLSAIADDNPVIFLEHRWLHSAVGPVADGYHCQPLDGPLVRRTGTDVTIVASAYAVPESLVTAEALAAVGVSAEVIDLRVVRPLEMGPILRSVERTGRLVTIDTGWTEYGTGAEIVARVAEAGAGLLKAPARRLGLPGYPTPSSRALAAHYYPTPDGLVDAVAGQLGLPEDKVAAAKAFLADRRGNAPLDVPNPGFKGPF